MKVFRQFSIWLSKRLLHIQIWLNYHQKSNWVSYRAIKIIKKSKEKDSTGAIQKAVDKWFEWMHPHRWRTSLVLALSLIILPQLGLGVFSLNYFSFLDENFLTTVWEVLASIIGISFVIVVFLTEYSQDQTYERRSFPIYISATSMIFTVMIGLLTLVSIGVNIILLKSPLGEFNWVIGASIWNSILFFLNLILVIILYIRMYQLLSPSYFRKTLIKYHRKKVLDRVYKELTQRIKKNLSFQHMENIGIEAPIFWHHYENKANIKTSKHYTEPQIIVDLNLNLLSIAKKNATKISGVNKKDQIIFWGLPGKNISNEYSDIAAVDFEINENAVTDFLQKAVIIKPWNMEKLENASDDLLINRDLISIAISSGQVENVEASLDLYIETIEAFLDSLKRLGYRFTPELADNENKWFSKWDIFHTVHEQFISLLQDALKSANSEIIDEFIGFPKKVIRMAFGYQDHFAFKQFIGLYPLIYSLSKKYIPDNKTSEKITEKCGLHLIEFANYLLEPKLLQKDLTEEELREINSYSEELLTVFSHLAKIQIDHLDYLHFKRTIGSIRKLLNRFSEKHQSYKIEHLKFQIEKITDEKIRSETLQALRVEEKLNSVISSLIKTRRSALFGLGTWLCHLIDTGKLAYEDFDKFFKPISQEYENLNILNESYINALSAENRGNFRWHSWEMDEWTKDTYDGGAFGTMHFSSWLSIFHTYQAITLMPENREGIFEVEPRPEIKGILDSTISNIKHFAEHKNWAFMQDKMISFKSRSQLLEKSLDKAYRKQLIIEEIEIIQSPLSEDKIKNFILEVEKTWQEQGDLRKLFILHNKYITDSVSAPSLKLIEPYGLHQRVPKGVFIENSKIGYVKYPFYIPEINRQNQAF